MEVKVSIIIVNHFHSDLLFNNISSIVEKTKNISYEIILINNTIDDMGIPKIKESFPDIILINNRRKKGFSENNNIGIRISRGEKIFILNPDTYLGNNAIYILYNYLKKNKMVGLCGPKLLYPDNSLQYSCRKFPTLKGTILRRSPLRIFISEENRGKDHLMQSWDHETTKKVDWMLGASLMIDKKVLFNVGLLDEKYFLYCEDIDISYQLKKNGLESHYVADAIVYHEHQKKSDKKLLSINSYFHMKSMFYFLRKNNYYRNLIK